MAGPRNQTLQPGVARDQPPPHNGGPQPGVAGHNTQVPQPGVAGDPHHTPTTPTHTPAVSPNQKRRGQQTTDHRHTTHTQPRTPAHAEDTPTATPHDQQRGHHKHAKHNTARPPRAATHTTSTHNKGHPNPRNTELQPAGPSQGLRGAAHHRRRRTPARTGGEPHAGPSARSGEEHPPAPARPQPRVAGKSTQDPSPGVARDQPQHTPATPPPTQQQPEEARVGNRTPPTHHTRTHIHTNARRRHTHTTPPSTQTPRTHTTHTSTDITRTRRSTSTHNTGNPDPRKHPPLRPADSSQESRGTAPRALSQVW